MRGLFTGCIVDGYLTCKSTVVNNKGEEWSEGGKDTGNGLRLMVAHSSWYTQVDNMRKGVATRKTDSENGHTNTPGFIPLGNI